MMDFYEDDMIINDRANAMDPVLLLAAAKNKLVPAERRGSVRRRDESQHEDENEVNESASPNKKRKLDDTMLDDKFAKSNRNSFNDFLPALIGNGNNNNNNNGDDDRKRNDQRLNNIFNGESNKNYNKKSNNNSDDDMPALVEDAEDEQQDQTSRSVELFNLITRGFNASNNAPEDDDMPILIESDDEGHDAQRGRAIVINDDDHDMPELTSEEDSEDEHSHTCPVHGPRPTCCPHHAENGYSSEESDNSEYGEDEENSYWDDEDEDEDDELSHSESDFNPLIQIFRQQMEHMRHRTGPSNHSSPSTSLRQESPFLRGGASPVAPHHLHSSSNTATSQPRSRGRRARAERDSEEYNEDYELDPHRPIDVPPLVWSDTESGYVNSQNYCCAAVTDLLL
jgi:hypothetical protein